MTHECQESQHDAFCPYGGCTWCCYVGDHGLEAYSGREEEAFAARTQPPQIWRREWTDGAVEVRRLVYDARLNVASYIIVERTETGGTELDER